MSKTSSIVSHKKNEPGLKASAFKGSFFKPVIQPKLTINPPNDVYEQEADAVAERVMRMPDTKNDALFFQPKPVSITPVQRKCAECEQEEKLQRKEGEEEDLIQQKKTSDPLIQRKCAHCEEEESNVQMKSESAGTGGMTAPSIVHDVVNSPGRPMDKGTKSFMESRFGYDFSKVQIHNDPLAHRSAKEINALAYTHNDHIVFGAGQYNPATYSGQQLLAHELTHVLQQKKEEGKIQRVIFPNTATPPVALSFLNMPVIDIHKKNKFEISESWGPYLFHFFSMGLAAPIRIKYGAMGEGVFHISPNRLAFQKKCDTTVSVVLVPFVLPTVVPIPTFGEDCYFDFNAALSTYDAAPQVIPFELNGLDTSAKTGTLVMSVSIDASVTEGKVGWVDGKTKNTIDPVEDYKSADFSEEAFLPFIYGNDYDGKNFDPWMYNNSMGNGYLIFNTTGFLSIANQQRIFGLLQLGDTHNWWLGQLTTNVVGANNYDLPIERTPKGELSGSGDGLTFDETWTGKGFTAKGKLQASYVNSNFFVAGTATYDSKRAKGELFLAVTDYNTAKQYAIEYLPEAVADLARKDTPAPDDSGRLAFVGAGKLSLTLFDGEKKTNPLRKGNTSSTIEKDDKSEHENKPVAIDASFVVEPEGYITVAGQIKQFSGEFVLFKEMRYTKTLLKLPIPITVIPLPPPFTGAYVDFSVNIKLQVGAGIGPLTLSQLKASGIYSNRPKAFKELELSGFVKLKGDMFADLIISLDASVGAGPFSITVVSKDIKFGASMSGELTAQPTITIRSSDEAAETPREYFIKGNFDFDAAGKLSYQISDRFKANAEENVSDKTKTPSKYKYVNSKEQGEKEVNGKDVEIPLDHSLGTQEPPDTVSVEKLASINLKQMLTNIVKGRKDKEYFTSGVSDAVGDQTVESEPGPFERGSFMEGGQKRGKLATPEPPATGKKTEPTYEFSQQFRMKGVSHTLHLIVSLVKSDDKIESLKQVLMMASSEMEELSEKIEEEKAVIDATQEPSDTFQKKDLQNIETKQTELKKEVEELAKNDELAGDAQIPEMVALAVPLESYANRYERNDLGIDDKPKALTELCPKPTDIYPGQYVVFKTYFKDGEKRGKVVDIVSYPDADNQYTHWHIKFRPENALSKTSLSPRAYGKNCTPNYSVPSARKNCKTKFIHPTDVTPVPSRYIGGKSYYGHEKAKRVVAVPLCWSDYQSPEKPIVGLDRIKSEKRWVRAHLLHGDLGGTGIRGNLVPASQDTNLITMPKKYENDLYDKVVDGLDKGTYYWFRADVVYFTEHDNYDVEHYEDFVKEIHVSYGVAVPKDADQKEWELTDTDRTNVKVTIGYEPTYKDIKSTRTEG